MGPKGASGFGIDIYYYYGQINDIVPAPLLKILVWDDSHYDAEAQLYPDDSPALSKDLAQLCKIFTHVKSHALDPKAKETYYLFAGVHLEEAGIRFKLLSTHANRVEFEIEAPALLGLDENESMMFSDGWSGTWFDEPRRVEMTLDELDKIIVWLNVQQAINFGRTHA